MNIKTNINKIKKKINLKKLMIIGLVSVTSIAPLSAVGSLTNLTSQDLLFNNKKFSSIDEAVSYVKTNSTKESWKTEDEGAFWTLDVNGKQQTFNDPKELFAFVETYIQEERYVTSVNIDDYKGVNNILVTNDNFWKNTYEANSKDEATLKLSKTIYQGLNDKTFENMDDAINSYFEVKEVYYFNNIYFSNASDLRDYLLSTFFPNLKEEYNTIVIKGPNGTTSNPISTSDGNAAIAQIKAFIENNARRSLSYVNKNTNERLSITKENLNSSLNSVSFDDLDYLDMKSNQGKSRYVIDNYDGANLIGPVFYEGVLDKGAFQNKDMWKRTTNISKQVYVDSIINNMIGQFFSTIIVDDYALSSSLSEQGETNIPIFRTSILVSDGINDRFIDKNGNVIAEQLTLDEWFLMQLNEISPELKTLLVNTNLELMKGNKYNTFNKIPILYNFLLSRIVDMGLGQNAINLVYYYFGEVCDYIQDALETILIDDSLLLNNKNEKLNIRELFNIGNKNYNINTSIEYFIEKIKEWPNVIAGIDTYLAAFANVTMVSGLIPFTSHDPSYLFEYQVMTSEEYNAIFNKLSNIYTTFSQTTYANALSSFVRSSTNPNVQAIKSLPSDQWEKTLDQTVANHSDITIGLLLKDAVLQNSQEHNLAKSVLNSEIRIYLETGVVLSTGYLSMLYNQKDGTVILDQFVSFVDKNPDIDSYKVYLAFIIDKKKKLNIINSETLSSSYNFMVALSRIIALGLGTSVLVGDTMSHLFKNRGTSKDIGKDIQHNVDWTSDFPTNIWPKPPNIDDDQMTWGTIWDDATSVGSLDERPLPDARDSLLWNIQNNSNVTQKPALDGGKVPLIETDWDLYTMPEGLAKKVTNNPANRPLPDVPVSTVNFQTVVADVHMSSEEVESKINPEILKNDFRPTDGWNPQHHVDGVIQGIINEEAPVLNYEGNDNNNNNNNNNRKKIRLGATDNIKRRRGAISIPFPTTEMDALSIANSDISSVSAQMKPSQTPDFSDTNTIIHDFTKPGGGDGGGGTKPPKPDGGGTDVPDDVKRRRTYTYDFQKQRLFTTKFREKIYNTGAEIANFAKAAFLPLFTATVAGLEIFFFVHQLLMVEQTQEFYVYTLADGTEYIWDGGLTVSKFMGLDVQRVTGIESMKLLEPIQITLPTLSDFYYYNGQRFYDPNELKKRQLLDILNGTYTPTNTGIFTIGYTFSVVNDANNIFVDSVEILIEQVLKDLNIILKEDGTYDFSNINKTSQFLSSTSYAFDGFGPVEPGHFASLADQIIYKTRPTYVAMLPEISNTGFTTGKLPEFVLPGMYWDGSNVVENKDESLKYIIDNSANERGQNGIDFANPNANNAATLSKNKVREQFFSVVGEAINRKNVLIGDFSTNKKYSEMNGNWDFISLFVVKYGGRKYYFGSFEDAQQFVLNKFNVTKVANYTDHEVYEFHGKRFDNEEQIRDWIERHSVFL